jgi:hypothetical protein
MDGETELGTLLVISPQLDNGVFACGERPEQRPPAARRCRRQAGSTFSPALECRQGAFEDELRGLDGAALGGFHQRFQMAGRWLASLSRNMARPRNLCARP